MRLLLGIPKGIIPFGGFLRQSLKRVSGQRPDHTPERGTYGGCRSNFQAGDVVDLASLNEKKLLGKGDTIIKVLANGEITKALTVKAQKFSAAAAAKIQAAGGTVEIVD